MVSIKIRGWLPQEPNPTWGYTRFGYLGKRSQINTWNDQNVEDIPD